MKIKQLKLETPEELITIKHMYIRSFGHFVDVQACEGLLGVTPKQALEISRWFKEYAIALKKELNGRS